MNDQSKSAEPKDPRVEAALREYLERVDRGEAVDREEFLARHAAIADELRSFIAAEDEVRKLAGAETPLDRVHDSTKSFAGHGQETIVPQSVGKRAAEAGLAGQFGRYRIIRALGKGAMGTVYLAEDSQIERQVALKTPHFTEDPTGEQRERFFREARAAGNLRHTNICPIYDFGQIDGKHFITMAYIEGRPLSAFIQPDKPQTERQILIVIRKLALGLQEAHDHKIVHRDLKPANIMVDKKGEPIIMDFGLAQQVRRNEDARLTQTGNILGTPAYMSPEQVEGELDKIGPSTDQYSLGVILYELLTGQLPFHGSVIAVMGQILTKEPPPPSQLRPDLDPRIEAACLKMMAKNLSERFASLKAVADELGTILKSPAAKAASKEKPAPSPAPLPTDRSLAGDRMRAEVGASRVLKSIKQKAVTESDLASLEELARKCYSRRDFEQVTQIIERIPEERRNAALQALLERARGKTDDISFLICDIDEAVRLNDRQGVLKKAAELLKIKPGHHRAMKIQEEFAGYGEGGAARIGTLRQFTQPWNQGGWIPWSVLAFGLAVFGVMTAVVVIYLGRTAVMIDIEDPGVEVAVKGTTLTITGPKEEKVYVEPGEQQLKITYAGFETLTKSFELKKGQKRRVTVSIVNSQLVARLENETAPPTPAHEENEKKTELAKPRLGKPPTKTPPVAPEVPADLLVAPFDGATAKKGQEAWAWHLKSTVEITNKIGMKMMLVPPGRFEMGSPETADQLRQAFPAAALLLADFRGERPVHSVTISKPFYLGKYEVTKGQFRKFVEDIGYKTDAEKDGKGSWGYTGDKDKPFEYRPAFTWRDWGVEQGDTSPVVNVSHNDATEFCKWLSRKEGKQYRLPTEAEWEYACRAGTTGRYYNGEEPEDLIKIANVWDAAAKEKLPQFSNYLSSSDGSAFTSPVGQFRPNNFGLYDMIGNAREWCSDWYDADYYSKSPDRDPTGPSSGSYRVRRGGSWYSFAVYCRAASRVWNPPEFRFHDLGFRLARSSGE